MGTKLRKPKSKRITTKKRNKIIKKVRQHNKKIMKSSTKKRVKNDDRIPNKFPFKLEMLKKLKEEHEKEKRINNESKINSHQALADSAAKQIDEYEQILNSRIVESNDSNLNEEKNITHEEREIHSKHFIQVIEAADVIIHVIDARDPLGTRSEVVENEVLSRGYQKSLILLLNKIDLVPKKIVIQWLNYLNKFQTTVAFKSCTDFKKFNIHKNKELSECTSISSPLVCIGAETLFKTIRHMREENPLVIGVVGLPNVGKSSVINSLARSNMSTVGCIPGVTTSVKEIKLSNNITILDSPGVILNKSQSLSLSLSELFAKASHKNSYEAALTLFNTSNHEQLKRILHLQPFGDFDQFLTAVAKRFGKLKRGGLPNHEAAARFLVEYFTNGKIRFYFEPPETDNSILSSSNPGSKPAFIFDEAKEALSKLEDLNANFVALKISKTEKVEMEEIEMKSTKVLFSDKIKPETTNTSKLVLAQKPIKGILKKGKKYI